MFFEVSRVAVPFSSKIVDPLQIDMDVDTNTWLVAIGPRITSK